jgi:hypothetical protein
MSFFKGNFLVIKKLIKAVPREPVPPVIKTVLFLK